ncbi:unnamed protein product [Phaeothamnion confervicola]
MQREEDLGDRQMFLNSCLLRPLLPGLSAPTFLLFLPFPSFTLSAAPPRYAGSVPGLQGSRGRCRLQPDPRRNVLRLQRHGKRRNERRFDPGTGCAAGGSAGSKQRWGGPGRGLRAAERRRAGGAAWARHAGSPHVRLGSAEHVPRGLRQGRLLLRRRFRRSLGRRGRRCHHPRGRRRLGRPARRGVPAGGREGRRRLRPRWRGRGRLRGDPGGTCGRRRCGRSSGCGGSGGGRGFQWQGKRPAEQREGRRTGRRSDGGGSGGCGTASITVGTFVGCASLSGCCSCGGDSGAAEVRLRLVPSCRPL